MRILLWFAIAISSKPVRITLKLRQSFSTWSVFSQTETLKNHDNIFIVSLPLLLFYLSHSLKTAKTLGEQKSKFQHSQFSGVWVLSLILSQEQKIDVSGLDTIASSCVCLTEIAKKVMFLLQVIPKTWQWSFLFRYLNLFKGVLCAVDFLYLLARFCT